MEKNVAAARPVAMTTETRDWSEILQTVVRWTVSLGIVLWVVLPLFPLLLWSFSFRWVFPDLLPTAWTLRAWEYVLSPTSQVGEAIWDTTVIALAVTFLSILIAIPSGRALGMHRFRGKRLVEFLVLAPTIVPGLAVVLGIHVMFIRYGLADSMLGVMLVHLIPATPYVVLVMAGVFANYNPEFEEQARSLGAGQLATFWYVTLPAIFPGMMVAGLFAFLISWSQYILTLLIGGGYVTTLPLLLFSFARGGDNAITGALSIVFIAPAIIMLIISSRYVTGEDAAVGGFGRI